MPNVGEKKVTIASALERIVEKHWEEFEAPIELSLVRPLLEREGISTDQIVSTNKFSDVIASITDRLSVHMFRDLEHPTVWRLAPSRIPLERARGIPRKSSGDGASRNPRIKYPTWSAFIKPLGLGKRRFIDPKNDYKFIDISERPDNRQDLLEITSEDQAGGIKDDGMLDYDKVFDNIAKWCLKNHIEIQSLYDSNKDKNNLINEKNANYPAHSIAGNSVIERGIMKRNLGPSHPLDALSHEEKTRILVPLDIVLRLIEIARRDQ
jgi:hypothetical protein